MTGLGSPNNRPHMVVLGNEKGGSGKSTTAVHIAVSLAQVGVATGAIDTDARQRTLARYMENRAASARRLGRTLPAPETVVIDEDGGAGALAAQVDAWSGRHAAVVVDTAGRDSPLARAALAMADTLVTPINDSFVDLDLLGQVDPETFRIRRPSFYAELVWETRKVRARAGGATVDWVVLRNRLSTLEARNMRRVGAAMAELARRIGFRVVPGLSERVIYRELFPAGLTLLDVDAIEQVSLSHVAARQELRELIAGLDLPVWGEDAPDAAAMRA